jgi:hypothetical protein
MNNLTIGPDWARQIARLRDRITEETHLIRWGNDFYRCCRPGAPITIKLHSPDGGEALAMQMRPDDLYITQIAGHREMGRYGSLTGPAWTHKCGRSACAPARPSAGHSARSLLAAITKP